MKPAVKLLAVLALFAIGLVAAMFAIAAYVISDQQKTLNRQRIQPAMNGRWPHKSQAPAEVEQPRMNENHEAQNNNDNSSSADAAGTTTEL